MARPNSIGCLFALLGLLSASPARAQSDAEIVYEIDDDALRRTSLSLVQVHCLGSVIDDVGLGFAFEDRQHVITVGSRGRCRSEVYVTVNDERVAAHRVRVSAELGVALLELDASLPESVVPFVAQSFADPVRGAPVAYFTDVMTQAAYESPFGLTRATVDRADPLRFDAPFTCAGSPVVDREGSLLGMCIPGSLDPAAASLVHIDDIEAWLAAPAEPVPTRRRVTFGGDFAYTFAGGRQDILAVGVVAGFGATFDDTSTLRGDFGVHALVHADDSSSDPPIGVRLSSGLFVGARSATYFENGPSLVLSLEIGAAWGLDVTPPAPGELDYTSELFLRPAARLSVQAGPSELTYEVQIDTAHPEQSIHMLQVGFVFE